MSGTLFISKSALCANFQYLQSLCDVPIAPVVKADAYGLTTEIVAPIFEQCGAKLFFTANLEEALKLKRQTLHNPQIAVFAGIEKGQEQEFHHQKIIPVLNNLFQIELYQKYAHAQNTRLPIFIHIDTGMKRLGLCAQETETLIGNPNLLTGLDVQAILSHFVSSDNPDSPLNQIQQAKIQNLKQFFDAPLLPPIQAQFFSASPIILTVANLVPRFTAFIAINSRNCKMS